MKETINLASHLVSSAMDKVKESPFAMKIVGFMEDGVNATLPYVKKYGGYAVDKIKQHPYMSGFIVVFAFVLWKCRCRCTRGKMMKAPGRDYMMLRGDFEKDPRLVSQKLWVAFTLASDLASSTAEKLKECPTVMMKILGFTKCGLWSQCSSSLCKGRWVPLAKEEEKGYSPNLFSGLCDKMAGGEINDVSAILLYLNNAGSYTVETIIQLKESTLVLKIVSFTEDAASATLPYLKNAGSYSVKKINDVSAVLPYLKNAQTYTVETIIQHPYLVGSAVQG
ncbi:hypothetical protein IFM89_011445 [Coptis chinensis]|uniref:Uncharacterized protein n=1 Tax=Coptis chinensis TaxID=261450 RepID=A0A835IY91_9MAGN|nr:hypothetical protein IFM89_011445 [Coptis chinensis]